MADPGFQGSALINVKETGVGAPFRVGQVGYHDIYFYGTFDGATVKLQVSPSGKPDAWFDVAAYTKTAQAVLLGERFGTSYLRWVVDGAGTNTNVNAAFI